MSSSSSTSWEDSWSSFSKESFMIGEPEEEEEEEEVVDMMTIARRYTDSRQITSFFISPKPLPMVPGECTESSTSQTRTLTHDHKARSCAIERAEAVKVNLDPGFPNFTKSLVRSNVSGGFWLGIPSNFCYTHLPRQDIILKLINEDEKQYSVQYIADRTALGAGWRNFSVVHKLVEGDALVFQLVKLTEFQVYIIRAYSKAETDRILGGLNFDSPQNQIIQSKHPRISKETVERQPEPGGKSTTYSEEVGSSEVVEGVRCLGTTFKDIKNLDNFPVAVYGSIIDSELSKDVRKKYYKLCRSQNDFLHDNLVEGIESKLAAGLISQTVDIAEAIRDSNLSTSRDKFAQWDQSLDALEQLGMNVGFLRARIHKLVDVAFDSDEATELQRYREAIMERALVKEELRNIEVKMIELEDTCKRFDKEIKTLKAKARRHKRRFQEEVVAPW